MQPSNRKLNELQLEFLKDFPHSPAKQKRAIAKYRKARKERETAQERLEAAKRAEYSAAETIVKTFGLQPVLIDGDIYDVACRGETVFLIERQK